MDLKFVWTPELSVHDATLDAQHQQLLEQINILLDAIGKGADLPVLQKAIDFLDDYTVVHFAAEEMYMRDHLYPLLDTHMEMHRAFKGRYEIMKEKLLKQGASEAILVELENDLARWWIEHIGKADKQYGDFMLKLSALDPKSP